MKDIKRISNNQQGISNVQVSENENGRIQVHPFTTPAPPLFLGLECWILDIRLLFLGSTLCVAVALHATPKRVAQRRGYRGGRDPFFAEAASKGKPAALPGGCASVPHSGAATPSTFRLEHPPGERTASAAE